MKRTLLMVSIIAITIASCHATYRNLAHNSSYENALSTEKFVLNERVSARKVEIFVNPDSSFEVVSRLILSANSSVDIMIYEMWSMDFYDLIDNITQRGVRVRILFEGNTYSSAGDEWNRNMSAMLYELNLSGRPIWIRYETNSSSYLHAKMMIIDNYITIIGSENYLPTSYPENPSIITLQPYSTPSRGWGVVVFDSGFAQSCKNIFESIFLSDTKSMDYDFSLDVGSEPRNNGNEIYSVKFSSEILENVDVYLVNSPSNSYDMIKWLIDIANHTIFIEAPYISNTSLIQDLIDRLEAARNRGVTVQIILEDDEIGNYFTMGPYLNDKGLHTVPAFSRNEILFLHNKGIIVDDEYVLIGSINWSNNSLLYNTEMGAIIRSRQAAMFFKECFAYDWNLSSYSKFDSDGDGLSDYYEIEHGLDTQNIDSDGDGLDDYSEVFIYNTDPTQPDIIKVDVISPQNRSYIDSTNVTIEWSTIYQEFMDSIEIIVNGSVIATVDPSVSEYSLSLDDQAYYNITILPVSSSSLDVKASRIYFWIDTLAPEIKIKAPNNNSAVSQSQIILNVDIWDYSVVDIEIYANGMLIFQSSGNKEYNISLQVNLTSGMNIIEIKSRDTAGNAKTWRIYIILEENAAENSTTTTTTTTSSSGQQTTTENSSTSPISSNVIDINTATNDIVNLIMALTVIAILLIIVITIILAKRKTVP